MNYREAKAHLYKELLLIFPKEMYQCKKDSDGFAFCKSTDMAEYEFSSGISNRQTWFSTGFCISIGFKIPHSIRCFCDQQYNRNIGPVTFSYARGSWLKYKYPAFTGDPSFAFDKPEMLIEWRTHVEEFMREFGYPKFWDRFTTLESVEEYLTQYKFESSAPFSGGGISTAIETLIFSALLKKPDLEKMIAHYKDRFKDWTERETRVFNRVVEVVSTHTAEELYAIGSIPPDQHWPKK